LRPSGLGAFVGLIAFFALTWIATRYGYRRKTDSRNCGAPEGRKASQVSANLGVAAAARSSTGFTAQFSVLVAMVAAFAEAGADTVSANWGKRPTASHA